MSGVLYLAYASLENHLTGFMTEQETTLKGIDTIKRCFHCGEDCPDESVFTGDKFFCCSGCRSVFSILQKNDLCDYYSITSNPGSTKKFQGKRNYDFLDDPDLEEKLIDFSDGNFTRITFYIPQMHCSSCIWILENLYKLDPGIGSSSVNFLQKKVFIKFSERNTSLKKIVELLDSIGYEPLLSSEEKAEEKGKNSYKNLYYKIGVAGFCFGNIMLLSFPEYLSINISEHEELKRIFAFINLALSIPVFFYSADDYFISAWRGLKKKIINIDFPLALGILVLFLRSLVDILFYGGPGFLDSLSGLILFLLAGKLFQNKSFDTLNFERNYKSFFPIAVTVFKGGKETTLPVEKLKTGDRVIIHNSELVPADSVLMKGNAAIDYSFVTGESIPVHHSGGEIIYAGGKQTGGNIEIETVKEVSQSYLTQLWNNQAFGKDAESGIVSFANKVSKYFTFAILLFAAAALINSLPDARFAFNAFTSVLIVACPCALALSTPFTLGSTMRIFGRNKFYLKNTHVIEKISAADTIVFDKTGTLTESGGRKITFTGENLSDEERTLVKSAVNNSMHPLSRAVFNSLDTNVIREISDYTEQPGRGITASLNGKFIRLGSSEFVTGKNDNRSGVSSKVYLSINGETKGYYKIESRYRDGLKKIISSFKKKYSLIVLSGDNDSELDYLREILGADAEIHFNQMPQDKLDYISGLQKQGRKILMVGDGLNDAGALKQSDIGITITDDTNNFSPACDAILNSNSFSLLSEFINFSGTSRKIIFSSFVLSFIYNILGLGFAFQGILSPLIAAVLMPLSSVSVLLFTTIAVNLFAKRRGLV